jgi:hypothetical protein
MPHYRTTKPDLSAKGGPMRILQIHPFLRSGRVAPMVGGMWRTALGLTCYLGKNGQDVAVYPWPEWLWGEPVRFGVAPGVSVLVYAPMAIPERGRLFQNWKTVRRAKWTEGRKHSAWIDLCFLTGFQNAIREFRPQIIHCHHATSDIPELFRLLAPKVPILLTCDTRKPNFDRKPYDRIIMLRGIKTEEPRPPTGYPEANIRNIEKPVMEESPGTGEEAQTRTQSSFERFAMENLRVYRELAPEEQPLSP